MQKRVSTRLSSSLPSLLSLSSFSSASLCTLAILSGCPTNGPDAGIDPDAGNDAGIVDENDAGIDPDAGEVLDAGEEEDAGEDPENPDEDDGGVIDTPQIDLPFATFCPDAFIEAAQKCLDDLQIDNPDIDFGEAISICLDAEPMSGIYDVLCDETATAPVYCSASYEDFFFSMQSTCVEATFTDIRRNTCALGSRFRDIFELSTMVVESDRRVTIADRANLSLLDEERIIASLHASIHTDVETLEQAFDAADEGIIRIVEVFDISNQRPMTVYEYGSGDNSFGKAFVRDSAIEVAQIIDGDWSDCVLRKGLVGEPCTVNDAETTCGDDLRCLGDATAQFIGATGRCAPLQAPDAEGTACSDAEPCLSGAGLVCAGDRSFVDVEGNPTGLCLAAWKMASFEDAPFALIPHGGAVDIPILVSGAATVTIETHMLLDVYIDDPTAMRITLQNPLGTTSTLFDGTAIVFDPNVGDFLQIDVNDIVGFPADESITGFWTLHVEDVRDPDQFDDDEPFVPLNYVEHYRLDLLTQFD